MKKINHSGFILAETLVVTVFLMIIFSLLYSNFYPLIGEYEKRESYDDVDSKYAIYWLKKLVEDSAYRPSTDVVNGFKTNGFMRFECKHMLDDDEKKEICRLLVKQLEVDNCDSNGNGCSVFITKFRIGGITPDLKRNVSLGMKKYQENCADTDANCQNLYMNKCVNALPTSLPLDEREENCQVTKNKEVFESSFKDYIASLPDYSAPSINRANYRIMASFKHKRDNNNYNSYATMEVNR